MIRFVLELDSLRRLYRFERGLKRISKNSGLSDAQVPACDFHDNVCDTSDAYWEGKRKPDVYEAACGLAGI